MLSKVEKKAAYDKEYRQTHKAKLQAYYQANRDRFRARKEKYYQNHKDEMRERGRKYYQAHKAECQAHDKEYRRIHRDEIRVRALKHYHAHKVELAVRKKQYSQTHRDALREYERKSRITTMVNGKRGRLKVLGKRPRPDDKCELCGKEIKRLNYHHWDASDFSKGLWVCTTCHWVCEGVDHGKDELYRHWRKTFMPP